MARIGSRAQQNFLQQSQVWVTVVSPVMVVTTMMARVGAAVAAAATSMLLSGQDVEVRRRHCCDCSARNAAGGDPRLRRLCVCAAAPPRHFVYSRHYASLPGFGHVRAHTHIARLRHLHDQRRAGAARGACAANPKPLHICAVQPLCTPS